jgi:ubiquinone/menaquinone biosynthesis C-methylase UbiE
VLEHFPNMDTPLAELSRVLRPGGILLTSRGTEESGRKAMIKTTSEFLSLLEKNGWQQIQITPWWKFYDRVLAVKHGSSQPVTAKRLSEVLTCSSCKAIDWERRSSALKCQTCEKELFITQEEIVLNEA